MYLIKDKQALLETSPGTYIVLFKKGTGEFHSLQIWRHVAPKLPENRITMRASQDQRVVFVQLLPGWSVRTRPWSSRFPSSPLWLDSHDPDSGDSFFDQFDVWGLSYMEQEALLYRLLLSYLDNIQTDDLVAANGKVSDLFIGFTRVS
jgi:hypothetical protein